MPGHKVELIERAFAVRNRSVLQEIQQKIALEYHNELMIESENLPDPFQFQMAGRKVEDRIALWYLCSQKPGLVLTICANTNGIVSFTMMTCRT